MKRILLFGSILFLLSPWTAAAQQEFPKVEMFGGYSYFQANPEGFDLNGWDANITGNLTDWFGVEGDIGGHYDSPFRHVDINSYTFMAGPKLAYRTGQIVPFAHFLIGASRAGTHSFGVSTSDYALAAIIGGGVDLKLNRTVAIRAAQADYVMTRFDVGHGDERQNNFRFSTGLVIRLGTQ